MKELASSNSQNCKWGSSPIYDGDEPCGEPAKYDAGGGLYLCEKHKIEAFTVWGAAHDADGLQVTTLTFVRFYICLSCHETTSRQGQAGDATLWVGCDNCKGPAHWCHSIPCNICEKYVLLNISDTTYDYAKRFGLKAALDEFGGDYVAKAFGVKA